MNQTNQKTENKTSDKNMNGKEQPSAWEEAATKIAGDNQLLASLLKLLISPFTLIAGVGIIVYLFIKNTHFKKEIEKLKEENKKLSDEKNLVEEEAEYLNKKYNKLKKIIELEQQESEQQKLSERSNTIIYNAHKNKLSYLK